MKMKEKSTNSQRQIYMGILAVFMAVTFCFLWGKMNVHAEENIYNGFHYETKEDGTIEVTGYDTDQIDISNGIFTIPSQIDGKDVTEIGDYAFGEYEFNSEIIQIKMPENLKVIRRSAFQYFIKVENLEIPDSVTTLENSSFSQFESIKKINLPASLEKYKGNAFEDSVKVEGFAISDSNKNYAVKDGSLYTKDYKKLVAVPCGKTDIEYSGELTSIGEYAFAYNSGETIKLPETVTEIEQSAFYSANVKKLYLSSNLKDVDNEAFCGMNRLKQYVLNKEAENYSVNKGLLYDKAETKLISVPVNLKEVSIADTVKIIGTYSFNGSEIKKVALPEGVEKIESHAFDGAKFGEISLPSTLKEMGSGAFYSCRSLISVEIPKGITTLDDATFYGCQNLNVVYIPETVERLNGRVFYECGSQLTIYTKKDAPAYNWAQENNYNVSTNDVPEVYQDGTYCYRKESDETEWSVSVIEPTCNRHSCCAIPSEYKDIPVGRILKNSCDSYGSYDEMALDIPDTVKIIDNGAFSYLNIKNFTSKLYIRIPKLVTSIGDYIFDDEYADKSKVIVVAESGSTAETWAKKKGYTVKRSLPKRFLLGEDEEIEETLSVTRKVNGNELESDRVENLPKGEKVRLEVVAKSTYEEEGETEFTYQWLDSDWGEIEGANDSVYEVVKGKGKEEYHCRVSDGNQTITYNFYLEQQLTFKAERYINDKLLSEDDYNSYVKGTPLKLEVKVEPLDSANASEVKYQWRDEEGNDIKDADKSVYEIEKKKGWETYYCVVSNEDSEMIYEFELGSKCTLNPRIHIIVGDKEYVDEEDISEIKKGQEYKLKVYANSSYENNADNIKYQWYDNDGNELSDDIGGNTDTVTLTKKTRADEKYRCSVDDGNYKDEWNSITVPGEQTLTVTQQINNKKRGSYKALKDDNIILKVEADTSYETDGKKHEITYQWLDKDEEEIPDETTDTFEFKKGIGVEEYYCQVSDGNQTKNYRFWIYAKSTLKVKSYINDYENDRINAKQGKSYKLTVDAKSSYSDDISYEWYIEGDEDYEPYCDENGEQYTGNSITVLKQNNDNEDYYVWITDGNETRSEDFVLGSEDTLDVESYINGEAHDSDNDSNDWRKEFDADAKDIVLEVKAESTKDADITYSWEKSVEWDYIWGEPIYEPINGATSDTYTVKKMEEGSEYYRCTVTDGFNTAYKTFYLKRKDFEVTTSVKVNDKDVTPDENGYYHVKTGDKVQMEVQAKNLISDSELTYQWKDDDDNILSTGNKYETTISDSGSEYYWWCDINNETSMISKEFNFKKDSVTVDKEFESYINDQKTDELRVDSIENTICRVEPKQESDDYIYKWEISDDDEEEEAYKPIEISGNSCTLTKQILEDNDFTDMKWMNIRVTVTRISNPEYKKQYSFYISLKNYTQDAKQYINDVETDTRRLTKGKPVELKVIPKEESDKLTYNWYDEDYKKAASSKGNILSITKQAGKEIYYCEVSDGNYSWEYTFVLKEADQANCKHEYVTVPAVEPTCTEPGKTEGKYCKKCGYVEKEQVEIPASGHKMTKTEAKAATCTEAGNKAYWTCNTCHKVFSDEHGKTETTVADMTIQAKGHTMTKTEAKAATCTEAGNKAYWTCNTCHKVFSDEHGKTETTVADMTIQAKGHTMTKTEAKAATCTEAGNKAYWTCNTCHKVFSDEHGKTETTVADMTIQAKGHTMTKTEAKAATCTEAGNKAYWTCNTCHKVFSDEHGKTETTVADMTIQAKGHTMTKTEAKASTCTEDGNTAYWTCNTCHKVFSDESGEIETTIEAMTIKATGHDWTPEWTVDKEASCTEEGSRSHHCKKCSEVKDRETIAKKAHNLTKVEAKAATCTKAGNKEYWTCSTCHNVFSDEHGKTEITVADMTIAKKPHTEVDDPAVAPTETTPGKTAGKHCSVCNTVLVAQKEIPATGKKQPSDSTNTPAKPSQPSQGNNGTDSTKTPKKDTSLKQGTKVTDKKSKVVYKVNGNKTVEYNKVNKKAKTAIVPTTVKVNGVNYQVTAIAPKAFANNKNLKKVVIPVSVRSIGKQAFSGCKNLKTIIINTPYLTKKSVGAKAFKGIHAKATIKVPKKQKKAYRKFLKSKGIGKKVKIK